MSRPAVVLVLAIAAGPGCSWITVTRAPPRPVDREPPVTCTRSVTAPVVDTIVGSLAVVSGITMAAWGSSPICLSSNCPADTGLIWGGVATAAAGLALGVSAGFGYAWTAECREIGALQLSCVSGVEASCTNLREGPPPKPNRGARCEGPQDCRGGTVCVPSSEGFGVCVDAPKGR